MADSPGKAATSATAKIGKKPKVVSRVLKRPADSTVQGRVIKEAKSSQESRTEIVEVSDSAGAEEAKGSQKSTSSVEDTAKLPPGGNTDGNTARLDEEALSTKHAKIALQRSRPTAVLTSNIRKEDGPTGDVEEASESFRESAALDTNIEETATSGEIQQEPHHDQRAFEGVAGQASHEKEEWESQEGNSADNARKVDCESEAKVLDDPQNDSKEATAALNHAEDPDDLAATAQKAFDWDTFI